MSENETPEGDPPTMARETRPGGPPGGGRAPRLVRITYLDHVEFKECEDPSHERPIICETVGFLDEETEDYLRVLWLIESYEEAPKFQGLVLVRSCILEVEKLTSHPSPEVGGEVNHASGNSEASRGG